MLVSVLTSHLLFLADIRHFIHDTRRLSTAGVNTISDNGTVVALYNKTENEYLVVTFTQNGWLDLW